MSEDIKRLALLGSTGSIGRQTLDVVRSFPDRFSIVGLGGGSNTALLKEQAEEFRPRFISTADGGGLPGVAAEPLSPSELASHPDVDLAVIAISGKAGLEPTLAAIVAGKDIALATKEALVMAGGIVMAQAASHGARVMPIDSEPSAVWQCLRGEEQPIARIILTASGGPFRHLTTNELRAVTPQQALEHPTWNMGPKITIDSATLMNKGFEAIEMSWLFGVPLEDIQIVIHPQSIVHSMVEFADGSVKAQLSLPDMRFPIQYALFYPQRVPNNMLPHLDFLNIADASATSALTFEPPDMDRFPCLRLALEAGQRGGTCPAVLSAADEVVVALFLDGRIGFADIPRLVAEALEQHRSVADPNLDDIIAADEWARGRAVT
jgi:1-deoxy-D-xylulose-5-phosphate reductoisomerase